MEKVLRSLLLEKFPEDLRVKIELLSRRRDIQNAAKHEELIKIMIDSGIENIVKLGPGTNRYAFKLDGFVIKVATDNDGKIDNLKEFKMAKRLYPYVSKTYEVSENGTLLVAEYIQPFGSYLEMSRYADRIRAILKELSSVYLIGDVGITSKNYANWGLRTGTNDPVCLDFAYVYEVSSSLFLCRQCKANAMLMPNENFTELICPACHKTATFEDIRGRIGNDVHRHEIGDLSQEGYRLTESNTLTELTESRSSYLVKKQPKNKKEEPEMSSNDKSFAESMSSMPFASPNFPLVVEITKGDEEDKPEVAKPVEVPEIKVTIEKTGGEAPKNRPTSVFSCSVDPDDDEDMDIPRKEHPEEEADETSEEEIIGGSEEEEESVAPAEPEKKDTPDFYEGFKENATRALSGISNMIGQYAEEANLFRTMEEPHFNDKNIRGDTFYKGVQNAIHRSLAWLCGFQIDEVPRNGGGLVKRFTPPDEPTDIQRDALLFLYRYWVNKDLNTSNPADFMGAYRNMFRSYYGFPIEWRGLLRKRLAEKMPLTDEGVDEIVHFITSIWCNDEDPDSESDGEEETTGTGGAFSMEVDDDEEVEDDGYEPSVRIDVVHDDDYDVLRLSYADFFGGCCIPFYANLKEINISNTASPSVADDRNGDWDWLIHIVPDFMFYTKTPEKYMAINSLDLSGDIVRIVILDSDPKTKTYVMGVYFIEGVYELDDDDDEQLIKNQDMLRRIFRMLHEDISYIRISHLRRSLDHQDMIHSEDEVRFVNGKIYLMDDDEDDEEAEGDESDDTDGDPQPDPSEEDPGDSEEEEMVGPEPQMDREFRSREDAAAAALLESSPDPVKEPERHFEPDDIPAPTRTPGAIPVAHRRRDRDRNRDRDRGFDRDR